MQMYHRKHENSRSVDTVEQAVGEPARDGSSDTAVDDLMLQRVLPNPVEKHVDLLEEGTAEIMALSFVPAGPSRMSVLAWRLTVSRYVTGHGKDRLVPPPNPQHRRGSLDAVGFARPGHAAAPHSEAAARIDMGIEMTRLPDAAIADLFHIASEALEREDHLLASAMQEAYRAHGLYADRSHGIGSLRERPWAYVIYRALHKQSYAVKYGVELRWEPRYTRSRADEMDIGIFHPSQQPLPVACIELDWWDSNSATDKVVRKMRTNFPDRTVRKLIVLLWRRREESTDPQSWVKPDLEGLGLNSETPWLHSFGAMTQPT